MRAWHSRRARQQGGGTGSAADIGQPQGRRAIDPGQLQRQLRLGVPARPLPLTIAVQIDQQVEVVHRPTVADGSHVRLLHPSP
jgi:hypothetical protein